MNIKNKIINLDNSDYHMHSMNFSDWLNTIEEIVRYAWDIGLNEIAITDHSDGAMDVLTSMFNVSKTTFRYSLRKWKNVHNDVNVVFWVEADIMNEDWDISDLIQWKESEFINLSAHKDICWTQVKSIDTAYKNAIEKHHKKIKCICHPCSNTNYWQEVDINNLIDLANKYYIPLEINWNYLYHWKTNIDKLHILIKNANRIYINSDAHSLYGLREYRKNVIKFLEENWYI